MFVFGILAFLGSIVFSAATRKHSTTISISLIIAFTYGTAIELLQTFIPQRGFDYADLTADAVGAILGVVLFHKLIKKTSKVSNPEK